MGLGARLFTPESPRPTLESAPDHDQRSSRRPHRWLVSSCGKGVQDSLTPPEHQVLCSTYITVCPPFPPPVVASPLFASGVRGGRNSVAPIMRVGSPTGGPEMASTSKIVGRGPKPRFHRTMSPLPKAKPTGGSNGDALPPPHLTL